MSAIAPAQYLLKSTASIPNSVYPLLHYPRAFAGASADEMERRLEGNGWKPAWRYGMFSRLHYHSNTHEALAVFAGSATCQFGSNDAAESSTQLELQQGDVLVIPAGVAHRCVQDRGLHMVGSYPVGAPQWDMCYSQTPVKPGIAIPSDPTGSNADQLQPIWQHAEAHAT